MSIRIHLPDERLAGLLGGSLLHGAVFFTAGQSSSHSTSHVSNLLWVWEVIGSVRTEEWDGISNSLEPTWDRPTPSDGSPISLATDKQQRSVDG